jgi:metal-responsive CopG/Arc/MetJ family transcriptional regulator
MSFKEVNMKVISVVISDNLYDILLYLSYKLKKNRSQIIRDLIIEEYKKREKEKGKKNV